MSSAQPFNSTSSFNLTSFIFLTTVSIFSLICIKFFCEDWNLSILTNIGSFDVEGCGVEIIGAGSTFLGKVGIGGRVGDSGTVCFREGIGGIFDSSSVVSLT